MKTGQTNGNGDDGKDLSQEELLKIIQKQNEDFAKLKSDIEEIKKSGSSIPSTAFEGLIKALSERTNYQASDDDREIMPPEDDYDKDGVRFCAPFVGYIINDDFRKGRRERIPFNKKEIYFKHEATRKVGQGRYMSTSVFSVYTSHSKAEIAWLRSHRNYKVTFFESTNDTINADAAKALKLSRILNVVREYELNQLIAVATEYNVPYTEDVNVLRINTATKIADYETAAELKTQESRMTDSFKDSVMLKENRKVVS